MLILIATLLALVPAIAVLYPILRAPGSVPWLEGNESVNAELSHRWQENIAALRNIELERSLGNLEATLLSSRPENSWGGESTLVWRRRRRPRSHS